MMDFLKYYFKNVFIKWWTILLFLPALPKSVEKILLYYHGGNILPVIQKIFGYIDKYSLWISGIVFWLLHIFAIYELKKKNQLSSYDVNLSVKYSNILDQVERIMPEESMKLSSLLIKAHEKLYTKDGSTDLNVVINTHVLVYNYLDKKIIDVLKRDPAKYRLSISVNASGFFDNFQSNLNELKEYNVKIGNNEPLHLDRAELIPIVDNINDNLNAWFSELIN